MFGVKFYIQSDIGDTKMFSNKIFEKIEKNVIYLALRIPHNHRIIYSLLLSGSIRTKELVSNYQEIQYNWIREKLSVSCSFRKRIVIQTIKGNVDDTLAWLNICQ